MYVHFSKEVKTVCWNVMSGGPMEHWWDDNCLENWNPQGKPFSNVILFTTNPTWTNLDLKLTLCSRKPMTEQWHKSQTYYSDTCLQWNLDVVESCLQQQVFAVCFPFNLQVPALNRICLQWEKFNPLLFLCSQISLRMIWTTSMEQILAKRLIITQEIIFLLCNLNVNCHVHKNTRMLLY
jgi:hypothetical protein